MKKIITILSLVVVSAVSIVGCSSTQKPNGLYLTSYNYEDGMDVDIDMGKVYSINNLEEGDYSIEFTAKEYEYGALKEEYKLFKHTIEHNEEDSKLKVGVDFETDNCVFKYIVGDSKYGDYTLDSIKKEYENGVALSVLDEDKPFELDSEVAIAVYSTGGEDSTTDGINIDNEFEIGDHNLNDVVVYMKISENN